MLVGVETADFSLWLFGEASAFEAALAMLRLADWELERAGPPLVDVVGLVIDGLAIAELPAAPLWLFDDDEPEMELPEGALEDEPPLTLLFEVPITGSHASSIPSWSASA